MHLSRNSERSSQMKSKLVLLSLLVIEALSLAIFQAPAQAKSSLKGVVVEHVGSHGSERTEAK